MKLYSLERELEIPKLVPVRTIETKIVCTNPDIVKDFLCEEFNFNKLVEEHMYLLCMDCRNSLKWIFEVAHGGTEEAFIDVKNIFTRALLCSSGKIIIAHNHPSGDPTPSTYDYRLSKRVKEAGMILGIELLDSLIVGEDTYYSMNSAGEL